MHDLTIAAALTVIAARSAGTVRAWTPWRVLATGGIIVVIIGTVAASFMVYGYAAFPHTDAGQPQSE